MERTFGLDELMPPWVADAAWQRTADAVFKALALDGCLTLHPGQSQQAAFKAAFGTVRHIFAGPKSSDPALKLARTPADVGYKDLGHKQLLSYKSGPWLPGTMNSLEHSVLQKVLHDLRVCSIVSSGAAGASFGASCAATT